MAALVSLLLGAVVAIAIGEALGLSFTPSDTPPAAPRSGRAAPMVPAPRITAIGVPADERVRLAATAVADALVDRGAPAPTVGPGTADLSVRFVATFDDSPEAYRIRTEAGGRYALEAAGPAGAAAGLYALADKIRSGAAVVADGTVQKPRLGLRLTDSGSVGREPDAAAFAAGTDYSLNTDVVAEAVLPAAPWVDAAVVARIDTQFRSYVRHALREGYNGVVVPGFLEYVTFDGLGVYPAGDPHIERAKALAAAFGPVFRYAHDMGLHVYLLTDMLAVSPPLEAYLDRTVGGLNVEDPKLWSVYQAGLSELFDTMPFVDGLMVRVGEGGEVYQAGWDYSSKLAVTSEDSVRAMLRALRDRREVRPGSDLPELDGRRRRRGRPAHQPRVVRGGAREIDDPHLVVSTKYVAGDFYSHLPLNPTLAVGDHRRIVEFQARREFEGFGALPNDLVAEQAQALRHFLEVNPPSRACGTGRRTAARCAPAR
ncbi:hypothetical protein ACFQX7_40635 [Luedemannella flava]